MNAIVCAAGVPPPIGPWIKAKEWIPHNRAILREAQIICDNNIQSDPEPVIYGLQPDLLGEWFVICSIARQHTFLDLFDIAWSLAPNSTAEFFVRISRDFSSQSILEEILNRLPDPKNHAATREASMVAETIIGNLLYEDIEMTRGIMDLLERRADSGLLESIVNLGYCFEKGFGFLKDERKAVDLYRKAADFGDPEGIAHLGNCYYFGLGVEKDLEKSFEFWREALLKNNVLAARLLVFLGQEIESQEILQNALDVLISSGEDGYSGSLIDLANIYWSGFGVPKNKIKAEKCYALSALQGNMEARTHFGLAPNNSFFSSPPYDYPNTEFASLLTELMKS